MKTIKNILIVCAFLFLALPAFSQAPDWGIADTLAHHKIGPGIQYTNIYFKGKKMMIWVTKVDLTNPYNKIEQVQSRHQVPDVARWTVQEHFKQNTYEGHKVCVAFNHDFFSYDGGFCIGLNISDGEIPYGGGWGRSLIAINDEKKAAVFHPSLDANIILPDESKIKIDHFNAQAGGLVGECILFNRFNAYNLTESGKYIKIKPEGEWTVNGDDISCEVLEISDSPIQSTKTEYVILLRGNKQTAADGKLNIGDKLFVSQKMLDSKFGTPLNKILNAFHGYPSIAFEGELHDGEYNNFENGREYEISSRVMAGMSKDGNTLYIVTTEMSLTSAGVNCIDITNYMLAHGAWNVVNFDSGGSVAIVVDEEMLNIPARGDVRPVPDALLAVSLAPETTEIASYGFLVPTINPSIASQTKLSLLGFSQYDEVLEKNLSGFTFKCEPEDLGWVDDNQVFYSGVYPKSGKITAEKNGKVAELYVNIQAATQIEINPAQILIDAKRTYPIHIEGLVNNTVFVLDPSVFSWSIDDESICSIENGILKGKKEGETTAFAGFDQVDLSMSIKVEIGKDEMIAENFEDLSSFNLAKTGVNNVFFSPSEGANPGKAVSNLEFDYVGGRGPFMELSKNIVFYGLPDSIKWKFENNDNIFKDLQLFLEDAQGKKITQILELNNAGDTEIVIPFATDKIAWDVKQFPIALKKIKLILNPSAEKKHYICPIDKLTAHYPEKSNTDLPNNSFDKNDMEIVYINGNIYLHYSLKEHGDVSIQLYGIDGKIHATFLEKEQSQGEHFKMISSPQLSPGIYIVRITSKHSNLSKKMIIPNIKQ